MSVVAKRFEDLEFGDEFELSPDVGMERVREFADAAHMQAGRFIDHEAARKEGLPSAIVPGIMSQGLLAAALHQMIEGGSIVSIDTVFRAPLQVDSAPTLRVVVTDIEEDDRALELDLTIVNEADETRVLGTAKVRC